MINTKKLKHNDIIVTPYTTNKGYTFYCTELSNDNVEIYLGKNEEFNIDGEKSNGEYNSLIFKQINQLYYNKYKTTIVDSTSLLKSIHYEDASGVRSTESFVIVDENPLFKNEFPIELGEGIVIIKINQGKYGNKFIPNNVDLSSIENFALNFFGYNIVDDGNGNLIDKNNFDTHVGNVFYSQGTIVFTNQEYLQFFLPLSKIIASNTSIYRDISGGAPNPILTIAPEGPFGAQGIVDISANETPIYHEYYILPNYVVGIDAYVLEYSGYEPEMQLIVETEAGFIIYNQITYTIPGSLNTSFTPEYGINYIVTLTSIGQFTTTTTTTTSTTTTTTTVPPTTTTTTTTTTSTTTTTTTLPPSTVYNFRLLNSGLSESSDFYQGYASGGAVEYDEFNDPALIPPLNELPPDITFNFNVDNRHTTFYAGWINWCGEAIDWEIISGIHTTIPAPGTYTVLLSGSAINGHAAGGYFAKQNYTIIIKPVPTTTTTTTLPPTTTTTTLPPTTTTTTLPPPTTTTTTTTSTTTTTTTLPPSKWIVAEEDSYCEQEVTTTTTTSTTTTTTTAQTEFYWARIEQSDVETVDDVQVGNLYLRVYKGNSSTTPPSFTIGNRYPTTAFEVSFEAALFNNGSNVGHNGYQIDILATSEVQITPENSGMAYHPGTTKYRISDIDHVDDRFYNVYPYNYQNTPGGTATGNNSVRLPYYSGDYYLRLNMESIGSDVQIYAELLNQNSTPISPTEDISGIANIAAGVEPIPFTLLSGNMRSNILTVEDGYYDLELWISDINPNKMNGHYIVAL